MKPLFYTVAKGSKLLAQFVIGAVGKGDEVCLIKTELAGFGKQLFIGIYRNYIGEQHVVGAKRYLLNDFALQRQRAFRQHGAAYLCRGLGGKVTFGKFIGIAS